MSINDIKYILVYYLKMYLSKIKYMFTKISYTDLGF